MSKNEEPPCLHCVLNNMVQTYMDQYELSDSTIVFAALADVVGDLLANSEKMFDNRNEIMSSFNVRAFERALDCMEVIYGQQKGKLN
jgi:hypothetical protein